MAKPRKISLEVFVAIAGFVAISIRLNVSSESLFCACRTANETMLTSIKADPNIV